MNTDIKDSEKDAEKLKRDEAILDLPEVNDIPGQENIKVPDMREMADTTISSDDEEGIGVFEDENGDDATSERTGPATILSEDELWMSDEDMEAAPDEEDDESNEDENDDIELGGADNVSADEKSVLQKSADNTNTPEDEDLNNALPDDTDDDGDKLNEAVDVSGKDLDIPGAEDDDADEAIGEEDEENNDYSLGYTR